MASAEHGIEMDVAPNEDFADAHYDETDEVFPNKSGDGSSNESPSDSLRDCETNKPPAENPDLVALTAELDALCSQANSQLDQLPRQTRKKLTIQTRDIFKRYEQHGSQQRLTRALEKFLLADDEGLDFTPQSSPSQPRPLTSRNVDLGSADLVRHSPFHAADLQFEISGDVNMPPWLLPALDRIFGLFAAEARALLKHHCEKYGDEPVFRAGIREYMQSQLKGVLESRQEDNLSLTPETRQFLRSVYERSPDLNLAEKRMLARATRLALETIDTFWEDMNVQRRAYMAMRAYVAARELERLRAETPGKRTQDSMRKSWGVFGHGDSIA